LCVEKGWQDERFGIEISNLRASVVVAAVSLKCATGNAQTAP
jgi:hypothetical protein